MKLGVTMPVLQGPLTRIADFAAMADDSGLDTAWDYEFYKNPFVMLGHAAQATSRITLATGVATAPNRTPFEMANAAADVDEIADGRLILGVGIGGPDFMHAFHSTDISNPVARMREYIEVLRMGWDYLSTAEAVSYQGSHYGFDPLPFNPWGTRTLARPRVPVYLGAMGPKMLQLAGEVADGTVGYLQTPRYVKEHVLPNVEAGAKRAGRKLTDIDIAGMSISSISTDRDEAMRRGRIQVGMYIAYPASDRVVQFHGLEEKQMEIRMALFKDGVEALEHVTSNELVDQFSISGTPDEARKKVEQYEGLLPHLILHTPYMPPLSTDEVADAYRGIIETFAR